MLRLEEQVQTCARSHDTNSDADIGQERVALVTVERPARSDRAAVRYRRHRGTPPRRPCERQALQARSKFQRRCRARPPRAARSSRSGVCRSDETDTVGVTVCVGWAFSGSRGRCGGRYRLASAAAAAGVPSAPASTTIVPALLRAASTSVSRFSWPVADTTMTWRPGSTGDREPEAGRTEDDAVAFDDRISRSRWGEGDR